MATKKAANKKKATKTTTKKAPAKKAATKKITSKKKAAAKKATKKASSSSSKSTNAATQKKAAVKKKATTKKAVSKKTTTAPKKKANKKAATKKAESKSTASKKSASKKKVARKKSSVVTRSTTDSKPKKRLGGGSHIPKSNNGSGLRKRRVQKEKKIVARISYPENKVSSEREKIEANYKPLSATILENNKNTSIRRYSDGDLKMFRDRIEKKLALARKELLFLQSVISRQGDSDTLDTAGKMASFEDGNIFQEREKMSQLAARQINFIEKLEAALMRIENNTYGVCRETGTLIEKERLLAVPHATLSMKAKLKQR